MALLMAAGAVLASSSKKEKPLYYVITRNFQGHKYLLLEGHCNGLHLPLNTRFIDGSIKSDGVILTILIYNDAPALDFIAPLDKKIADLESESVKKPDDCLFRRWVRLPLPNDAIVNNLTYLTADDSRVLERTCLYSRYLDALLKYPAFTQVLEAEKPELLVPELEVYLQPPGHYQKFNTFVGMLPVRLFKNDHYVLLEADTTNKQNKQLRAFVRDAPVDLIDSVYKFIEHAAKAVHPFAFPYVGDEPFFMNRTRRFTALAQEIQEVTGEGDDQVRTWTGQFILVERIDQQRIARLAQTEHIWVHFKDLLKRSYDTSVHVRYLNTTEKEGVFEEVVVVSKERDLVLDPALLEFLKAPLNQELLETRFFSVLDEPTVRDQYKSAPFNYQLIALVVATFGFGALIPFILFYSNNKPRQ